MTDAPYINGLIGRRTAALRDEVQGRAAQRIPSEPHYVWMEAGTNVFTDHTFTTDNDASMSNRRRAPSTSSTQLDAAGVPLEGVPRRASQRDVPDRHRHGALRGEARSVRVLPRCRPARRRARERALRRAPQPYTDSPPISPPTAAALHVHHARPVPRHARRDHVPERHHYDRPNMKAGDTWLSTNLPPLIEYTHTHDARDLARRGTRATRPTRCRSS